ncbi:hypothetical protein CERSUDRAFT_83696 [Gelatoporia subvermispora B]|uniref:Uncharacterized protein n=1 Tax=Ceriporiopsis subvermispora (strain B) TaxID=914234 RepID=M2RCX4_CERS8|nr:hypothetical protein CERSUDRAFT_83696 [Gelatoporia subvermispora B]
MLYINPVQISGRLVGQPPGTILQSAVLLASPDWDCRSQPDRADGRDVISPKSPQ